MVNDLKDFEEKIQGLDLKSLIDVTYVELSPKFLLAKHLKCSELLKCSEI